MLSGTIKREDLSPSIDHLQTVLVDIDRNSAVRGDAEQFVADCFRAEYSATVDYFLNNHILCYERGLLNSVVGYHAAGDEPLYLEQYLTAPIETVISDRHPAGETIHRSSLVEVGNLASTSPGSFRRLVLSLCRYFHELGYSWVVFTSTPQLLNTFRKLGVELIYLSDAHQDNLKAGAEKWGSYYQQKPKVVAGNIAGGLQGLVDNPVLRKLLDRAPKPQKVEW